MSGADWRKIILGLQAKVITSARSEVQILRVDPVDKRGAKG